MGQPALKFETSVEVPSQGKLYKQIAALVVLFTVLLSAWAISFPPIYYHLFVN